MNGGMSGGMFLSPEHRFGLLLAPDEGGGGGGSGVGAVAGAAGGAPAFGNAGAAGGGTSTGQAGGSGGGFQPPAGMRLVKDDDWSARDSFYSKAQEAGFKDVDTLSKYGGLHKTFTERGIDPAQYASILGGARPQQNGADQKKYLTQEEVERMLGERETRSRAESEHDGMMKSMPGKVEARVAAQLKSAGLKPESVLGKVLQGHIMNELFRMRQQYPADHPLHKSHLAAVTDEIIEQTFASGKFDEMLTSLRGEYLAAIGDTANGGKPSPNNSGGSRGTGVSSEKRDQRHIPHEDRDDFDSVARKAVSEVVARRGLT